VVECETVILVINISNSSSVNKDEFIVTAVSVRMQTADNC